MPCLFLTDSARFNYYKSTAKEQNTKKKRQFVPKTLMQKLNNGSILFIVIKKLL